MQPNRFAASLTTVQTAARVARARGALRWRIISTFISMALLALIVVTLGRDWPREWLYVTLALWIGTSLIWLVVSVFAARRAKRDLARIGDGVAFFVDSEGVEFVQPPAPLVPWERVGTLRLKGGHGGAGPKVVLEAAGATVGQVPLSFLDVDAAAIDSAARAYSLGRFGLDVTALDRVL